MWWFRQIKQAGFNLFYIITFTSHYFYNYCVLGIEKSTSAIKNKGVNAIK